MNSSKWHEPRANMNCCIWRYVSSTTPHMLETYPFIGSWLYCLSITILSWWVVFNCHDFTFSLKHWDSNIRRFYYQNLCKLIHYGWRSSSRSKFEGRIISTGQTNSEPLMPIQSHIKMTKIYYIIVHFLFTFVMNKSICRHKARVMIHGVYVDSFIIDEGVVT